MLVRILLCLAGIGVGASLACANDLEEPKPTNGYIAESPAIKERVTLGSGVWPPVGTVDELLRLYPTVLVGRVDGVLQSFDPRPGALGLSQEELDALQAGPKGAPLPSDILNRPPGNGSSVYSITVVNSILGDIGDSFALMQSGGIYEGKAYEFEGDPVVLPGSTYLFFLEEFDWRASGFVLNAGYDKLGAQYQTIYQAPAFGRFLVDDGKLQAVDPRWSVGCETCDALSLLNRSLDEAVTLIHDASEGKPLPTRFPATPAATPAAYALTSVNVDTDSLGNSAKSLGSRQECISMDAAAERILDLTVQGVPEFDSESYSKGIAGLGVTLRWDPSEILITAFNPEGDSDTILAGDGDRIGLEIIDTDGVLGPPTSPLPANKGYLRIDMADASQNYEHGDGVLVRLVLRAVGSGTTDISIGELAVYDASGTAYSVGSVSNAKIVVDGNCP
jgi:hypothetical protein